METAHQVGQHCAIYVHYCNTNPILFLPCSCQLPSHSTIMHTRDNLQWPNNLHTYVMWDEIRASGETPAVRENLCKHHLISTQIQD